MTLKPGEQLGPYEIRDLLGKGGMGEVYKAHDTRLQRDVALKVSKDQFSERFTREARAIAALNHPNVCTLHDVGPNYLVMEFVEGETLAARIKGGAIPLDEALKIARQISAALTAADEKGITHRDLKPGNIMIRPDGLVKVLDFGLAKIAQTEVLGEGEEAATLTMGATRKGEVLGTPAYMSPEQARGKNTDKRADIWAFGVVLHEMLTGQRLFQGEDLTETLASVVKDRPDLSSVPRPVRRLLGKCLEKDPAKRLRDIGDVWELLESGTEVPLQAEARPPWVWIGVAGFMLLGLIALGIVHFREKAPVAEALRFTIPPPDGRTLESTANPEIAVSPDGRTVAFVAVDASATMHLWVRPLNSSSGQQLEGTEGAYEPFWSPDSKAIAFFAGGKLKRIAASGGSLLTICDVADPYGGTWNADGVIVFAGDLNGPLQRVPAQGGVPAPATTLAKGDIAHLWPQFLPDGKRFLYYAFSDKRGIQVQTLTPQNGPAQDARMLIETPFRAAFAPPDQLLFFRGDTLLSQTVDPNSLEFHGEPVAVSGDIAASAVDGGTAFSVSNTGVLAYRSSRFGGDVQIGWYSRDGKRTGTALEHGPYEYIELSRDNRRLAVERESGSGVNLWMLDLMSGVFSALTFGASSDMDPVWSPDSRRLVHMVLTGKNVGLHELVVGSSGTKPLYSDGRLLLVQDWSADGKTLLFNSFSGNPISIMTLSMAEPPAGERKPQVIHETKFSLDCMRISPDGMWIAFTSPESGKSEVYIARFPSFTEQRQISSGGGTQSLWRKDGKELFYLSLDSKLMALEVRAGATLETGMPKLLFQTTAESSQSRYAYAVTSDGQRFLIREPVGNAKVDPIQVVANWPAAVETAGR